MADILFTEGGRRLIADHSATNAIDLIGDTLKVMLVGTGYVGNPDDVFVDDGTPNDPASHEISATGYSRKTLTGKSITSDLTNDRAFFDADDVQWANIDTGATIGAAVLYRQGTNDTTSHLIAKFDVADTPTNGGPVTLKWHADGLIRF